MCVNLSGTNQTAKHVSTAYLMQGDWDTHPGLLPPPGKIPTTEQTRGGVSLQNIPSDISLVKNYIPFSGKSYPELPWTFPQIIDYSKKTFKDTHSLK